jgi:predicted permease
MLSDRMWRRQFSSDPHVLGAPIALDGTSYIVVGIMPPDFAFPDSGTVFWIPLVWPAQDARLVATARLRDGFSVTTAAEEISDILYRYRREHALPVPPPPPPPPKDPAELSKMLDAFAHQQPGSGDSARPQQGTLKVDAPRIRLVGFQEFLLGSSRPAMLVISTAVACVLVLACVNLAGLLLARGATRRREIAVRFALGASRGRLIRQLLTETGLLSLSGAGFGVALTVAAVGALRAVGVAPHHAGFAPAFGLPRFDEVTVNRSILIFAVAISLASGLAAAVIPALTLTRRAENDRLRDECGASSEWRLESGRGTRGVLVAIQIAMATTLTIAALQLIRSYDTLSRVDLGYKPEGVLTFQVVTPPGRPHGTLRDDLIARLQVLPGVRFASVANLLPTEGTLGSVALRTSASASPRVPPPPAPGGSSRPEFPALCIVGRDYFNVMGIRVVEGRGFTLLDRAGAPRVMAVNRALAQTGYLGADPIGRLVYTTESEPWRIVGIVDDVRQFGPTQNPGPQVFVPIEQSSVSTAASGPVALSRPSATLPSFVVRTSGDPERAVPLIRGVVKQVDPAAAVDNVETMNHLVSNTVVRPRVYAVTLGAFAGVAALLAIIGVYGLIAYAVRHRTPEIGIRMALGADGRTILSLVLGQGVVLIWLGILFGTGAALATSGMLRGMLFGVAPFDPLSYGVAAVGLAIAALGGCYIPARRAMSVDPLVALRHE